MAKIVQTSDFTGAYRVSKSAQSEVELSNYINKFELLFLMELLGVELANLVYADITTPFTEPNTAKYKIIFNTLNSDEPLVKSNGIKQMLVEFIYFEFTRNQTFVNTITGNVNASNEVSTLANQFSTNIVTTYNTAVDTYFSIQKYITFNLSTYPEYKGVCKHYTW